jgi:hypothetical protein
MEKEKVALSKEEKKEEKAKKKLREVKERTIGYIMLFPFSKDGILIKFIYAIVVTLVIIVVTFYLLKLLPEKKDGK